MYRLRTNLKLDWQSAVAIALLGVWLLVTIGMPVDLTVTKDLTIAFPCQDHGCGCNNAEACWNSCCCHSLEERIVWANENEVEPPDYFWAQVEFEKQQNVFIAGTSSANSSVAKSCCSKDASEKQCCTTDSCEDNSCEVVIVLDSVRKCQGLQQLIALLSVALLDYQTDCAPVGPEPSGFVATSESSLDSFSTAPPTPPPCRFI
ncbi:MAG: hypothetical protein COA78_18615 [Blastopirellula sp.]|nr:MAG: hypothetical protein COA78_18615 [Blastopirellula sp.]